MKVVWKISSSDKKFVKDFLHTHKANPFVKRRVEQNITRTTTILSKKRVWHVMVGCLLTTQQRSGPGSKVFELLNTRPYPFDYQLCVSKPDIEKYVYQTLSGKGIRRTKNIASEIAYNLTLLENGLWTETLSRLKNLKRDAVPDSKRKIVEREIADFIDGRFNGFGPKQSRNLLQWLGLSRYETPIDSRIIKWLKDFGFPVALSPNALGDKNYYHFVSDGFQELCKACKVYPCILDAAIFASYDGKNWTNRNAKH